jgi:hypothetical protein
MAAPGRKPIATTMTWLSRTPSCPSVLRPARGEGPPYALVADLLEVIEANEAIYPEGATVTGLELGGIKVVRLDYALADPESSSPAQGRTTCWWRTARTTR